MGAGGANDKAQQQRLRSNMLVMNSSTPTNTAAQDNANAALDQSDPNKAFTSNVIKATKAEKAVATRLSNLSTTIAQGKIIDAVIETAINTDLPGSIRAIVSRDVFAESGREVMIPKGSRLIGTYNSGIVRGQNRVLIVWTRLIRPDGLDMAIGSPGVDALGRAGIEGIADNKYSEIFSAALLTSIISIGVAAAADAATGNESTTTTTSNDGNRTTTGTSGTDAARDAVETVGEAGKGIVSSMLNLKPTIVLDQGSRINVFVNKDLIFPSTTDSAAFVQ